MENREMLRRKNAVLISKGLARPPPPAGFHYCHNCRQNVCVDNFDLNISAALCIMHYAMRLAAKNAGSIYFF